jgi:prepilin-type N-terminal cleavage/methylation domain-containing protein
MSRMIHRRNRGGYTLIELLVVMTIIGILIGIAIPAVMRVKRIGPRVTCTNDIRQIEQAIEGFKSTYKVKYIPSAYVVCANYDSGTTGSEVPTINVAMKQESKRYYKSVWNRGHATFQGPGDNGTGLSTTENNQLLDGSQCLVFFLMGPTPGPSKLGFGDIPKPFFKDPNSVPTNLFLEWPANRLDSINTRLLDPWGQPYIYFSSKAGNDYGYFGTYYGNGTGGYTPIKGNASSPDWANPNGVVAPFKDVNGKHLNSMSFQIVSAGERGELTGFGPGGLFTPGRADYDANMPGGDDLSNFATRVLSAEE